MKGYVKVNILCLALLIGVVTIVSLIGGAIGMVLVLLWCVITGALNYMEYLSSKDPVTKLMRAAPRGQFTDEVNAICKNYEAVSSWSKNATQYDSASSISKSYDLISLQMLNILESATKYIKTYDYISRPRPTFLQGLQRESYELVRKLHELQELILKIDDSTSDVDISYVDDLLDGLRQMSETK